MTRNTILANEARTVVSPGRVVLGADAVSHTGDHAALHGDTALVLATEQIAEFHGDTVLDVLEDAGVETVLYTDVRPDPTVENIEAAYDLWEEHDCDVIVTLGGGSSIDTGKGVGILATNDGSIRDFAVDRAGYEGVPNPTPPLIAVNTTAGTGSEATRSVVVSDESTSTKFLIVSQNVVPDVAIEDPKLTVSLPKSHTAFTGIDALTHAIEAYVSVNAYSVPDGYAESAMERIARSLPVAWANGENLDARADMMVGQLQAGQAFTNSSVALVHGLARPLGAQLHIPHGLANGLILPYVVEFSAMAAPEKYAAVARILGVADENHGTREAADLAAQGILQLCEDLELTRYLDDFGAVPSREEYLDVVGEMTQDAIDSGSPDNNPRKPTADEIENLYVTIYDDALAPDSPRRS
ncbi:iron-containing alcohol dehydrogenase [Halobacterium sp. KA-4]|uniref:iron-containing alcohol dehydrogenase n=1 Tax=Halobacterium sp. KA-4 TaxID=2896367 RepID=UPI001E640414|nr:iron-containing alcohol dehydrogenase [Halobacterium sp. KA-4]MCD2201682.1 iron-containing alcohol dehydrogenase [Halobacterium sp. KA-4]